MYAQKCITNIALKINCITNIALFNFINLPTPTHLMVDNSHILMVDEVTSLISQSNAVF